jgi:hypothetical protein
VKMNNYKYLWNMGLAFDEDRAIKKMSVLAKEGWILKEMALFRYKFEKSKPKELIYSMDYKVLLEDSVEYFEIFNNSGWKHMCSYGPYHFFSAKPGTISIYTDKANYLGKYKATKSIYLKMLIISIILLIISWVSGSFVTNKVFNMALFLIGLISTIIAIPSLMVTIAYAYAYAYKFKKIV